MDQLDLELEVDEMQFSLGDYFDNFKGDMLRTVPPTRQFESSQIFKHGLFLLCFVQDFD